MPEQYLYLTGRLFYPTESGERESLFPGLFVESWLRGMLGNSRVDWLLENQYLLAPTSESGLENFQVIRVREDVVPTIRIPEQVTDETEDLSGDPSGHSA